VPLGSFARAARRLDMGYASTNPFKFWRKSYEVLGRMKTSGPANLPKPFNRPSYVPRLTYRTPRSFSKPTIWFLTKCWLAHRWQTLERICSHRLQSSSHQQQQRCSLSIPNESSLLPEPALEPHEKEGYAHVLEAAQLGSGA